MKACSAATIFVLLTTPILAHGQDSCSYATFVDAIKAMSTQFSSMTDKKDRHQYARCYLEEQMSSSSDGGGSFSLGIPEVVEVGESDGGGTSSTTTRKSDCEAIKSSADYANATASIGANLSPALIREARLAYEACHETRNTGKPYCRVSSDSSRVSVRITYGTNRDETEATIKSATARIISQSTSSEEEKQLFTPGTVIPDKTSLVTNFSVPKDRRVIFEIETSKGSAQCEAITVNRPISVYGHITPELRQNTRSTARFGENAYHTQCNGFPTGRPIRGCVPEGSTIVGHSFVDVPKNRTAWKIIPNKTSFKESPPPSQNCFVASASVWEPETSFKDIRTCQKHIQEGTYYFVDVSYTTPTIVNGTTQDVAYGAADFPLKIRISSPSNQSQITKINFHFTIVDERGNSHKITSNDPSSGPFTAVILDGKQELIVYRTSM